MLHVMLPGVLSLSTVASASQAKPCRVLLLSGGGSYGAFEIGVLSRLIDENPELDYDFIMGVSAGALNTGLLSTAAPGPAGFAQTVDEAKDLWLSTRNRDVWEVRLDPLLGGLSLLSTAPLKSTIETKVARKSVLRNVTVGTTDLASGATVRHDEGELRGPENLSDAEFCSETEGNRRKQFCVSKSA